MSADITSLDVGKLALGTITVAIDPAGRIPWEKLVLSSGRGWGKSAVAEALAAQYARMDALIAEHDRKRAEFVRLTALPELILHPVPGVLPENVRWGCAKPTEPVVVDRVEQYLRIFHPEMMAAHDARMGYYSNYTRGIHDSLREGRWP